MADVTSEITAVVWKVLVKIGDVVEQGDELAILESMKMEIPVMAPEGGIVTEVQAVEGASIQEGDRVVSIAPEARS